jgi:hypothetical protein
VKVGSIGTGVRHTARRKFLGGRWSENGGAC